MALTLEAYSMGVGDRFGHQAQAQLRAMEMAQQQDVTVVPVWNKSHREHTIICTDPAAVRAAADAAVAARAWQQSYYVDADHIGMRNVDLFIAASNFFTLDVADFTGRAAAEPAIDAFVAAHRHLIGQLLIPGITEPLQISEARLREIAGNYLLAVQEAGRIYRHIAQRKGADNMIAEVSMDETDKPQTPVELLVICAMIAAEKIPAQTLAPKFSGRFNKGVDYVGDVETFAREFDQDICVLKYAVTNFELPANLKLSVHSGSDKFSIYAAINASLRRHQAGLHLKTAGTTWLEELIGLAVAGDAGLEIAREIYGKAYARYDELCMPYATVIDIDPAKLPTPQQVNSWDGQKYAQTLRHDQSCSNYNEHVRQLLHVGYKVASEIGARYLNALQTFAPVISENVTANLYQRHICPVFLGVSA